MNQHIEIEFKNLLTKAEFASLLAHFQIPDEKFRTQKNHYFDTEQFTLKKLHSALRIRSKADSYELTLKQPANEGLLETNEALTKEQASTVLNGGSLPDNSIRKILGELNVNPDEIIYFGTLTTARAEISYEGGLLVFDHSTYLDTEDFELEYEVSNKSEGQIIFADLLNKLKIPLRETDNKVSRFYQQKLDQKPKS